ncbi:hypothetical protein K1719_018854 [Acacia pycnantha]|nr:hypothetical protein K1719_018854 [Acacia pycnantha]
MDPPFYGNCRRNKGDTILHCAINGDYFDLAFQIIHLYKELANSRLGRIETIIYHCLYVEKLKAENQTHPISEADSDSHDWRDDYSTLARPISEADSDSHDNYNTLTRPISEADTKKFWIFATNIFLLCSKLFPSVRELLRTP